ncbi:hypothetical protein HOT14_gp85 [Escherichia phage vB_EcoS_IME347]|uniref:Uncharacterized protein n=1 Tax=Escherichia phage vB_EcoS_IME347 TaxID=2496546 RepID=A0A2S1GSA6_9CAUD|nr:hypothetical protein HOT14_gp85 [Escherichia phage vB_EcoS_IME347]AWD92285.1 hypothetical protein [Escherichia phage vB_EcoS_IME347]
MKKYFHTKLKMYFIERNGTFFLMGADGIEMELAYRPPVAKFIKDGIWIDVTEPTLEQAAKEAGIEQVTDMVSNLFDELPNAGSHSWDLMKLQAINRIRQILEESL